MKRLRAALILGAISSAVIIALHATRVTRPLEQAAIGLLPGSDTATRAVGAMTQYAIVVLLSVGIAWLVLASTRRKSVGWIAGILAIELLALAWVCLLYQVVFQPLPSLFAVLLGFVAASGYAAILGRSPWRAANEIFRGRVSGEQMSRIVSGDLPFAREPKSYEVTAVVCDIANKHDLAEEDAPEMLAEVTEKFISHATQSFLKAGAYVDTVTGEGIVALFGFPGEDADQAEKATRHALSLLESFAAMRNSKDGAFGKFHVHLGISSGRIIIAPLQRGEVTDLLTTGEPVELARRFCIANRFYGSRVLIGPRTFELTSRTILARPIDFLSGVDVRERHEIYEPLTLAAKATPEEIARRDSFWNGVVLYREKRWGEAYTQFQQARGPGESDDSPLQLYLRRIEPLALHLAMTQDD